MDIQGSCLAFPFTADQRGTLVTVAAREKIVEQSILSILSTRRGERVMLPDYGKDRRAAGLRSKDAGGAVAREAGTRAADAASR